MAGFSTIGNEPLSLTVDGVTKEYPVDLYRLYDEINDGCAASVKKEQTSTAWKAEFFDPVLAAHGLPAMPTVHDAERFTRFVTGLVADLKKKDRDSGLPGSPGSTGSGPDN